MQASPLIGRGPRARARAYAMTQARSRRGGRRRAQATPSVGFPAPLTYPRWLRSPPPPRGRTTRRLASMNAAKPEPPVKPGEIIAGKYRVERVLGVGGMGFVIAATHLDL